MKQADLNIKNWMDSNAYDEKRAALRRENANLRVPELSFIREDVYGGIANLRHAAPSQLFKADYRNFKKSLQEKFSVYGFKKELGKSKNHKFKTILKGSF